MQIDPEVLEILNCQVTEDDIGQMFPLYSEDTGLPMVVLLSDSMTDKGIGLFVYDSLDWQIGTNLDKIKQIEFINSNTSVLQDLSIQDIAELKKWLQINKSELAKLYTGILSNEIVPNLKPITESFSLGEMSNLHEKTTGIKSIIYTSEPQASHGPRIKIKLDNSWISIKIAEEPELVEGQKFKVNSQNKKLIKQALFWTKLNYKILMQLFNREITPAVAISKKLYKSIKDIKK